MPFFLSERLAVLEPGCAVSRAPSQQTFTAPGSSTESVGMETAERYRWRVCVCVCQIWVPFGAVQGTKSTKFLEPRTNEVGQLS